MKQSLLKPTIVCAALAAALPALASDDLRISGFGTVGAVHSDNNDANFLVNLNMQPNTAGAGMQQGTSLSLDTKFGVQVDYTATSWLSLTMQAVSRHGPRSSWTPEIEWAFAKFKVTPNLDVRVGRIRPDLYMLSDYLDVNYANPWVRPPTSVYSQIPISHIVGMDMIWRQSIGDVNLTVQPFAGQTDIKFPDDMRLESKNLLGIKLNAEIGEWNIRFGHTGSYITLDVPDLEANRPLLNNPALIPIGGGFTLGQAFGGITTLPTASQVLTDIYPDHKYSTFTSLGFAWDNGDWLVSGEYAVRKLDFFDPDTTSWYLSAAYRVGKWTPYIVYSDLTVDSRADYTISSYKTGLGAVADAYANSALSALGTEMVRYNPTGQSVWTLGTRYDLMKGVALKGQWDIYKTREAKGHDNFYRGWFGPIPNAANTNTNFTGKSQTVNVLSFTMDYVF